jgi:plastocyanin
MRWFRSIALAAVVLVVGVGCSNGDDAPPAEATSPATTPTEEPTSEPPADDGATVTMGGFAFAPDPITTTAGQGLSLRNADGSVPHTFTVRDTDVDVEVGPGDTVETTIDLAPGDYDVFCRFHEGQGMTASLTVG